MASLENPFLGMNPFLELRWPDAHTKLIAYISDALSEELPPDLAVRAEERVSVGGEGEERDFRADVGIREDWKDGFPPLWQPPGSGEGGALAVAKPEIVLREEDTERWLEIHDLSGRLVTVIELLSPANKTGAGWEAFRRKQQDYLAGGVNLVEIDLLRDGRPTVAVEVERLPKRPGFHYVICVTRAGERWRHEVYRVSCRDRLPAFRVPLRRRDPDVPLDLQPLVDRCYRTGRYWQLSDPARLHPGWSEEELAWIRDRLAETESGSGGGMAE